MSSVDYSEVPDWAWIRDLLDLAHQLRSPAYAEALAALEAAGLPAGFADRVDELGNDGLHHRTEFERYERLLPIERKEAEDVVARTREWFLVVLSTLDYARSQGDRRHKFDLFAGLDAQSWQDSVEGIVRVRANLALLKLDAATYRLDAAYLAEGDALLAELSKERGEAIDAAMRYAFHASRLRVLGDEVPAVVGELEFRRFLALKANPGLFVPKPPMAHSKSTSADRRPDPPPPAVEPAPAPTAPARDDSGL